MNYTKKHELKVIVVLLLVILHFQVTNGLILKDPLKMVEKSQSIRQTATDNPMTKKKSKETSKKPHKTKKSSKKAHKAKETSKKALSSKSITTTAISKDDLIEESSEKEITKKSKTDKKSKTETSKTKKPLIEDDEIEESIPTPAAPSLFSRIINSNTTKIVLISLAVGSIIFVLLMLGLFYLSNYIRERENRLKYMESLRPAYTSKGPKNDAILAALDQ
jgi:hypothetical protein